MASSYFDNLFVDLDWFEVPLMHMSREELSALADALGLDVYASRDELAHAMI
jgi:hypothetical protein